MIQRQQLRGIGLHCHLRAAIVLGAVLLPLAGAACSAGENTDPAVESLDAAPDQVVARFYGWYIETAGFDPETQTRGNPIADGSYAERPELSAELIQRIETDRAQPSMGGGDPIVCAQDVPTEITVGEPTVSDGEATVVVDTSFPGHSVTVRLTQDSGAWRIAEIACP